VTIRRQPREPQAQTRYLFLSSNIKSQLEASHHGRNSDRSELESFELTRLGLKSLIQEYNHDVFHGLRDPGQATTDFTSEEIKEKFMQPDSEMTKLFIDHNVGTDISIELLHRHFEVPKDKRLVRVSRVVTPWSESLFKSVSEQPGIGQLLPGSVVVHNGLYYPHEFRYLTKAEVDAENQSSGGKGRIAQHTAFLETFARFVQEKGIAHIIGLRFVSAEEQQRARDPTIHDYEVTDDGCHMTTLSSDAPINALGYEEFGWSCIDGEWNTDRVCYGGGYKLCACASAAAGLKCENSACMPNDSGGCLCKPLLNGHKEGTLCMCKHSGLYASGEETKKSACG